MLRWTAGVTRMDRIRNETIRQKIGVAPIADKMRQACLRWYGHVLREKEDSVRKTGLNFEVIGNPLSEAERASEAALLRYVTYGPESSWCPP
ncbi:unnamed protein product [Heligmosomoides polygyrus]|uniref:HTH_48 domain-containing protein n=1 Tax=Heligmosomoides polygyrus TaxID=6339 RepID=A0A183GMD0_HELPZ|nr:unnamed protein product [Heligmosomoides polygyrus]